MKDSRGLDPRRIFNPQDSENTVIYAWVLEFPKSNLVELPSVKLTEKTTVQLLGTSFKLHKKHGSKGTIVDLSSVHWTEFPSKDVFILKIQHARKSYHNPLKELMKKRKQKEKEMMALRKMVEETVREEYD